MTAAVVLVGAGQGLRLGAAGPKAFVDLAGEPLLSHAMARALAAVSVRQVVVVVPATHLPQARDLARRSSRPSGVTVVPGGAQRSASVAAGLRALPSDVGIVLVHDVARCLAPPQLFDRLVMELRSGHSAVVPGLPVNDTVKQVDLRGRVIATPDRATLRIIQTPQAFLRGVLEQAHASGGTATDDAGLVERAGGQVQVVEGDPLAAKITTATDLAVAERLLAGGCAP